MKLIRTEEAVGHVLCHDMTQIIKDQYKDARFRKGHIVTEDDIPVLLSMGKENLYVWEMTPGMVHENDAAERLLALCGQENMLRSETKEGKIELTAACDGLFRVDSRRLVAVNSLEEIMIATRHGNTAVKKGDKLAGMRVIPLIIKEETLQAAEQAAGAGPLLELLPYVKKTAAIVATGSEVKKGLIQDTFTPVVKEKLAAYGIETIFITYSGDGVDNVAGAISGAGRAGAEMILCAGGMSVDPDDNTPGGIQASGARIVTYGAPVLPGAMFLLGYFEAGTPICGLPGCVMYAGATIFDLALPRIAAGVELTRRDFAVMGEGGLCLGCKPCEYHALLCKVEIDFPSNQKGRTNMKKCLSLLLALCLTLSLAACGSKADTSADAADGSQTQDNAPAEAPAGEPVELIVFAAASMTETMNQLKEMYEQNNPSVTITYNFDSSGTLLKQIKEGADCDLFISAAPQQMNAMDGSLIGDTEKNPDSLDLIVTDSRVNLLENKVTLTVPAGNPKGIESFDQLAELLKGGEVMLAIGNSDVPVGQYTLKIFNYYGIDETAVADKLTYGNNVKEVASQVSEGAVDCGIIYATDAHSAGLTVVDSATAEMCGQVIYPATVLKGDKEDAAQDFLAYLQTDAAMTVFESVGFSAA